MGWLIDFDFRYNAVRVAQHLDAGREFLDCAADALEKGRLRVVAETLFAGTELVTKAMLIQHFKDVLDSRKHGYVRGRLNWWAGKLENTNPKYAQLFNRLDELRQPGRYLRASFDLSTGEAEELLDLAGSMYQEVASDAPTRVELPATAEE